MPSVRFEWDEAKNIANQRKHGMKFEQPGELFDDPFYISINERIVDGEVRWQSFGLINAVLLLMAVHTVAEVHDAGRIIEVFGIISARYATPKERRRYEDENG